MSTRKPYIGGQAVLEGVMMRAPACVAIAVRRPDGSLVVREALHQSRLARPIWKLPGLRGVVTLIESFTLGYDALKFSAEQQATDEERDQMRKGGGSAMLWFSTLAALALFIMVPQLLTWGLERVLGVEWRVQDPAFHLVTGTFKLLIVLTYLVLIGRVPEMRRVFQYHGAEHKTIHAIERGLAPTVENVRPQSTLHPRCGTTFLVVVIVVSIVLGSLVTPVVLPSAHGVFGQVQTFLLRVGLLPLVAAISYELQRFSARYCVTGPLRVLLWPGFLVQKITTREPDDLQIEVAIAAMQTAAWRERVLNTAPSSQELLVFADFAAFGRALPALRVSSSTQGT